MRLDNTYFSFETLESIHIQIKRSRYTGTSILDYPTGNCQVSTIQYFNMALKDYYKRREELDGKNLTFLRYLACMYNAAGATPRNIILIDMNADMAAKFLAEYPPRAIRSKFDYKSTNGSSMSLIMFTTTELTLEIEAVRIQERIAKEAELAASINKNTSPSITRNENGHAQSPRLNILRDALYQMRSEMPC